MTESSTSSKVFKKRDDALAVVISLVEKGLWFRSEPLPGGASKITVATADATALTDRPKPTFAYVQEGGCQEIYLHAFDTMAEAKKGRKSCAAAAYNTSEIVKVEPALHALGERFYRPLEDLLQASIGLGA